MGMCKLRSIGPLGRTGLFRVVMPFFVGFSLASSVVSAEADTASPHTCSQEDYPRDAVRNHVQGNAIVSFRIATDGSVGDVAISQSTGNKSLDDASIACATAWRYRPRIVNGKPIEVPWRVLMRWRLNGQVLPDRSGHPPVGNSAIITASGGSTGEFCTTDGVVVVVISSFADSNGSVQGGQAFLQGPQTYSIAAGHASVVPGCYEHSISNGYVKGTGTITSTVWFTGHNGPYRYYSGDGKLAGSQADSADETAKTVPDKAVASPGGGP
jgi:TonB family protein